MVATLYLLSGLFLLIALLIAVAGHRQKTVASKRGVAVGGDNTGVINTGKVKGNIHAAGNTQHNPSEPRESPSMNILTVLASLAGIASAVLAAVAYFLPPPSA